jgi:hypothetical protein
MPRTLRLPTIWLCLRSKFRNGASLERLRIPVNERRQCTRFTLTGPRKPESPQPRARFSNHCIVAPDIAFHVGNTEMLFQTLITWSSESKNGYSCTLDHVSVLNRKIKTDETCNFMYYYWSKNNQPREVVLTQSSLPIQAIFNPLNRCKMARNLNSRQRKMIIHMISSKRRLTTSQMAKLAKCSERSITNIRKNLRLFSSPNSPTIPPSPLPSITSMMLNIPL